MSPRQRRVVYWHTVPLFPSDTRGLMTYRTVVLLLGLTSIVGCRIEHRVPAGAASETDQVREVVYAYYRALAAEDQIGFLRLFVSRGTVAWAAGEASPAADYWSAVGRRLASGVRPMEPRGTRVQVRVQGRLATAWAVTEWMTLGRSAPGESERAVFFLIRDGSQWRLVTVGIDDFL